MVILVGHSDLGPRPSLLNVSGSSWFTLIVQETEAHTKASPLSLLGALACLNGHLLSTASVLALGAQDPARECTGRAPSVESLKPRGEAASGGRGQETSLEEPWVLNRGILF